MPANGTANLRPCKKGEVRNPYGRNGSEDKRLTTLLKKQIGQIGPIRINGHPATWEELIVRATMSLAIKGNPKALQIVWERLEGRMPLPLTGEANGPIRVTVVEDLT